MIKDLRFDHREELLLVEIRSGAMITVTTVASSASVCLDMGEFSPKSDPNTTMAPFGFAYFGEDFEYSIAGNRLIVSPLAQLS